MQAGLAQGAGGLRAERKTGRRVVVVLVEHVFQKIPGRSSNAAGQKNQRNKTSRTLRNVQSSRISCSSSCSCSPFFFFFLWWLIAKFKCHGKRTAATPLGFMFPQFSWYWSCYTRLSPSLSLSVIGPKTLARRAVGSLQRDIAVKIFQIVVTLVTSYGEYGEWEQVVPIEWSVLASEVPSGP